MGRTSSDEFVRKFSIPFLVDANFWRPERLPVVFCIEPSVRNLNSGPLQLVWIAVLIRA